MECAHSRPLRSYCNTALKCYKAYTAYQDMQSLQLMQYISPGIYKRRDEQGLKTLLVATRTQRHRHKGTQKHRHTQKHTHDENTSGTQDSKDLHCHERHLLLTRRTAQRSCRL